MLALRAGQIDLAMQFSPQEAQPFKNNSKFKVYSQPVSAHRQVCMRTDVGPLKDPRVRRAVALTINRPEQVAKVMLGNAQIGNDNPFWKNFASTDHSTKQRVQNLTLAKALLTAAGAENLKFNITTWNFLDHTDHAASIQAYARRGRHRRRDRGHGRLEVLRLRAGRCGLRLHDALAEPDVLAHRVRRGGVFPTST